MLEPGGRLLHFDVVEKIGEGGMGAVFRARDTKLGRDVALKVLPPAFTDDEQRMARFLREAQVLAALNHPHLGTIHGLEEDGETKALVLELVEGEELGERIERGALPLPEAMRIARQIAEGMEAAHAKGVIHRDLKPSNIKITPDGTVKVLDFGLAKALAADESPSRSVSHSPTLTVPPTEAGMILGTAGYMAPEQARGHPVDRRADVWAFGVILYEMVTGGRLFAGKTTTDVLAAVIRAEPDMDRLPAGAPPSLRRLLIRCLAKDPAERMRDFGDVSLELRDAAGKGGGETDAAEATASARPKRGLLAALVLLSIVTGVAGFALRGAWMDREPLYVSMASPMGTRFHLEVSSPAPPAVSPDGRAVAFAARDGEGKVRLYVRRFAEAEPKGLPGTEGAGYPFWSPDGTTIGFFVRAEAKLKKIDANGGPVVTVCAATNGKGAAWASDGAIIFTATHDSGLVRVQDTGGVTEPLTELDFDAGDNSHRHPWLTPDERHVLFFARGREAETGEEGSILAVPVDGGEPVFVIGADGGAMYAAGHLLYPVDDVLMARPFDGKTLRPTGNPFPITQGVKFLTGASRSIFSVSEDLLTFVRGTTTEGRRLRWIEERGTPGETLGEEAAFSEIDLSPDGRYVAAAVMVGRQNESDIWVYDTERGVSTRFTFSEGVEDSMAWSPDSSRIYFGAEQNGIKQIYVKPLGGTEPEELVYESPLRKDPCDVSPDGKYLSFTATSIETGRDVWALPLNGEGEPFLVAGGEFGQGLGMFSPDGRWMAYTSTESGQTEVYVVSFPESRRKWQVSTNGGNNPRWDSSGKRLYFQQPTGEIQVVDIETTEDSLVASAPRVIVSTWVSTSWQRYAPTPDGTRFLIVEDIYEDESSPLELVFHWGKLLER